MVGGRRCVGPGRPAWRSRVVGVGRAAVAAAAAALGALVLAGCQGPLLACPAIGWSNALTVTVAAAPPALDDVAVACAGCDPVRPSDAEQSSDGTGSWTFGIGMATPEHVEVSLLDGNGTALTRQQLEPEWKRVGGTERCGGPMAATVTIRD